MEDRGSAARIAESGCEHMEDRGSAATPQGVCAAAGRGRRIKTSHFHASWVSFDVGKDVCYR
eukprot:1927109-Rhodomonas_salina.1